MNDVSTDILSQIIKFIDCQNKTEFFLVNKKLNELFFKHSSCCTLKYENLICCQVHSKNRQKINVIKELLIAQDQLFNIGVVPTIHFRDLREMEMADPYISRFGKISHKCCNGLGVMYDIPLLNKKKYSFTF